MPEKGLVISPVYQRPTRRSRLLRQDPLAPYTRVRRIEFFELPTTIPGKIRRIELPRREIELVHSGVRAEGEHREEDFPDLRSRHQAE